MKKFFLIIMLAAVLMAAMACESQPDSFTVTFDPNGGSIVTGESVQTVVAGQSATPPTPERRDYAFDGWEGSYEGVTADVTVRAKWTPVYLVRFETEGGSVSDSSLLTQKVRQGESAVLPSMQEREGYEFDGWDSSHENVVANTVIRAKWTRVYRVTYVMNGGVTEQKDLLHQTVRADGQAQPPEVTREHHTLTGWEETRNETKGTISYAAIWKDNILTATQISKLATPATVEVSGYRGDLKYSTVSGFFISADGTLVTSFSVINNASEYKVRLSDSTEYDVVQVVAFDPDRSIAILKADVGANTVPYLSFAAEKPAVGDPVYAVGSSLGLTGTFSSGIVSYVDRDTDGVKYIQSTAPISAGNGGGPLIDQYGEVVGVNVASYTGGQNLNLSVTVKEVNSVKPKNLSPKQYFEQYAVFKYFIGEQMIDEKESSSYTQECPDGHTVQGKFDSDKDVDVYLTKIDSDDDYLAVIISAKDAEELYYVGGAICYSTAGSVSLQRLTIDEKAEPVDEFTVPGPDDSQMLVVIVEITPEIRQKGITYMGLAVMSLDEPMEYQYFSCGITEEQYDLYVNH